MVKKLTILLAACLVVGGAMAHEHAEQATLRATEDYAEGVASVFERREADFIGR